jgi:6-phosphofructokinase 1
MGYRAVMLLAEGVSGRVIAMSGEKYVDYDINEALAMKKDFDFDTYRTFSALTFLDRNLLDEIVNEDIEKGHP